MRALHCTGIFVFIALGVWACKTETSEVASAESEKLRELRNLGKAFYETPGSSEQAVAVLREARELVPDSARERLNYGLALLAAGQGEAGVRELLAAQELDPMLPHTYFKLGVEYKQAGEAERAIEQFERMLELTPDEAKAHYNLGQLYKQLDRTDEAIEKFEKAAELDPSLAAPHFQLYNSFRRSDPDRAKAALEEFQRIKALQDETGLSEDVNWSYYAELYDPVEPGPPAEEAATTTFSTETLSEVGAGGRVHPIDLNADGAIDLVAWGPSTARVFHNEAGNLNPAATLPQAVRNARNVSTGDPNNDGFPELCTAGSKGAAVLLNNAGALEESGFTAAGDYESCRFHDYDHDGDEDLFLVGATNALYRYSGDEAVDFAKRWAKVDFPFENGKRGLALAVAELFEDNGNDVIIAYEGEVVLYQDRKLGRYDREGAIAGVAPSGSPVRLETVDADNDGAFDVALTGPTGRTRILRNWRGLLEAGPEIERTLAFADLQNRGWLDAVGPSSVALGRGEFGFETAGAEGLPERSSAAAADFDGDGRADLAGVDAEGRVFLARNRTETGNHYLTVALEGVKTAKLGRGARVEVKAGDVYRKRLYPGYPVTFGLGGRTTAQAVRVTWPNGMIQNEARIAADQTLDYVEKPRLSGSCPMIFTWNGERFEYISEVLGVAPLGASLGGGKFFPVDHDEYVWIDGERLQQRDGAYEVRITEELRETAYLDQIRLIAVDHPEDVAFYTNEKFKAPPFPEFALYGVREPIRPVEASDHRGHDVLDRVTAADGRTVDGFERTFRNTAEMHWTTFRLPAVPSAGDARLFLTGWVDWADASTVVRLSQTESSGLQTPVLEVEEASGEWRTVDADLGLPGGRTRTMSVELPAELLERGTLLRVRTNLCVYWDEIFAATGTADPDARLTRLSPESAELRFRGFSENIRHPERRRPESFDYQNVSTTSSWNPTEGRYTRFGPVGELLDAIDDRLVVMGSGDELVLRFSARDLPALEPGRRRDFLLFVDGWAKENEANTAFGDTVEPLPFHSMSSYPFAPGDAPPDSAEYRKYLEQYQTRGAARLIRPLYSRAPQRQAP